MKDPCLKAVPPYDDMTIRTSEGRKCRLRSYRCQACKQPFQPVNGTWRGVRYVAATIEHNCMRGDDEVHFFHPECTPKAAKEVAS